MKFLLRRLIQPTLIFLFCLPFVVAAQTTYTFTPAGATGRSGPTQSLVNSAYSNTNLSGKVTVSSTGIQKWVVPHSGIYRIKASGARGGDATGSSTTSPGSGATMEGEFFLKGGDTLYILVGQKGEDRTYSGGGGGGTFITKPPHNSLASILVIAGGGGASSADFSGIDGTKDTCGTFDTQSGPAQCGGKGGISFTGNSGGGGGGFFNDGQDGGIGHGGDSYVSGGLGGSSNNQQKGGFGGGGGQDGTGTYAGSGGGGFSGGNGGNRNSTSGTGRMGGGGGGSYNSGANQNNITGNNYGDGKVEITVLSSAAANDASVLGLVGLNDFCPGNRNIYAIIGNFGTNRINSVDVNWSIGGVTQTSIAHKDTLDTLGGNLSAVDTVFLGVYNFSSSSVNLLVWTSNPNGKTDTATSNDTLSVAIKAGKSNPIAFNGHIPLVPGSPFSGRLNAGTIADPDGACINDTVTFEIVPPKGFTNAGYGTKWFITDLSLKTDKGYSSVNKKIVYPSVSATGYIMFYPGTSDADSLYKLNIVISSPENSCDSSYSRYIQAFPKPTAAFSTTSTSFCRGMQVSFTNTGTKSPTTKHKWYFGDGVTSADTNAKHTYSFSGTYTVSLVSYNDGCGDSITKTITIDAPVSGAAFKQGTKFQGYFFNGTANDPDLGCVRDTLMYEIAPPPAFSNGDYGTKWEVSAHSIKSTGGTSTSNYSFVAPSSSAAGYLMFTPKFSEADLTFVITTTFKALSSACTKDTTVVRYVSVSTSPTADFTFKGQCVGEPTYFTDASTVAPGLVVRKYEFGVGTAFATTANPNYTYTKAGDYTVTYTVTGKGGCDDVIKKKITIYDKPTADFSMPSTVCAGNPAAFVSTSTGNGTTITRYKWTFTQNTPADTSDQASTLYTFKATGTYSATLQVWTDGGCNSSVTKTITVVDAPTASFSMTKACVNSPLNFINSSTGAVSYEWRFSDQDTIRTKDAVKTFKFQSSYSVTLVATSASGCRDSVTKQIEFHDQPKVNFTTTGSCAGQLVNFKDATDFGSGSSSGFEWTWTIDGKTLTGTNTSYTFATAGNYSVKLRVKTNNGCVDSFIKAFTIDPAPTAGMTLPQSACVNVASAFENTSTGTGLSYLWDFGDSATSQDENPQHTYTKTGTFQVKLITTNGKGCKDSVTKSLKVGLGPEVPFKWCAKDKGKVVKFEATDKTFATYEWDFGDILGGTGNGTTPTYTFLASHGEYSVTLTVTDATGCVGTYTATVGTGDKDNSNNCIIGIESMEARKLNMNIYPNPFSHKTLIEYELLKSQQVRVSVWDATGKQVAVLSEGIQQPGIQQLTLDANEHKLSAGLYMIRIETEGAVSSSQVLRLE